MKQSQATRGQARVVSFPPGTMQAEIDGITVIGVDGALHSALVQDFDGDGNEDVIYLETRLDGRLSLRWKKRETKGFRASVLLREVEAGDPSCVLRMLSLRSLSPEYAELALERQCGEAPTWKEQMRGFLALESTPRWLDRVRLVAPLPASEELGFGAVHVEDLDQDAQADLRIEISTQAGSDPVSARLTRRHAFVQQNASELDAYLEGEAQAAWAQLAESPARAGARGLALRRHFDRLCRQGREVSVALGDSWGFQCGMQKALGRIVWLEALHWILQGNALLALEALQTLPGALSLLDEADRGRWEGIVRGQSVSKELEWRALPKLRLGALLSPLRPSVSFMSENELLLRGEQARVVLLDKHEIRSADPRFAASYLSDPSERFALYSVENGCDRRRLVLSRLDSLIAKVATPLRVSTPLLEEFPWRRQTSCSFLPAQGAWHFLAWSAQGIVATNLRDTWLIPLDAQAQSSGAPRALPAEQALPQDARSGRIDRQGRWMILPAPWGLVVQRRFPKPTSFLVWAPPEARRPSTQREVALSPLARRLVLRTGERLWLYDGELESW